MKTFISALLLLVTTSSFSQNIAEHCFNGEFLTTENSAEVVKLTFYSQANGTFYGILVNELLSMEGELIERYDFEIKGSFIYGESPTFVIKDINGIESNTTIYTNNNEIKMEGDELPTILLEQQDYFQKPKNWLSCN